MPKPKSQPERSLLDKMTCAVRAAYYKTEKKRVRRARDKWIFSAPRFRPKPYISVIIPTHNRLDILLDRALPSVLNQTCGDFEVIVACHDCSDSTFSHCYLHNDDRVDAIEVPRKNHYPDTPRNRWLAGPVEPLNAALKYVKGDWIARIDDDDEWAPDHLEKLLSFALKGGHEFVSAKYTLDLGPGGVSVVPHDGHPTPIGGTQTWLWRSYLKFMKWNPDCWRKSWNAVNDTDLAQRMRDAGVDIGHLDETTCHIRPRPGETKVGLAAYLDSA